MYAGVFPFPRLSHIGLAPSKEVRIKTQQSEAEHFDLILSAQPQLHLSSCFPDRKTPSFQALPRPHQISFQLYLTKALLSSNHVH